jgi:hypothetical protein
MAPKKRIQLNRKEWWAHYGGSLITLLGGLLFFLGSCWLVVFPPESSVNRPLIGLLISTFIIVVMGFYFFLLMYKTLDFIPIKGPFTEEELTEAMQRFTENTGGSPWKEKGSRYTCFVPPAFSTPSSTITLEYEDNILYFSAIKTPKFLNSNGGSYGVRKKRYKEFKWHLNSVKKQEAYAKRPEFNDTQWNWKMILARIFLYPLSIFLIWLCIVHVLPAGKYLLSIFTLVLCFAYLFSDLYMIFNPKSDD